MTRWQRGPSAYGGSRGQRCHEGARAHGSQGERERNDGKTGRRERQAHPPSCGNVQKLRQACHVHPPPFGSGHVRILCHQPGLGGREAPRQPDPDCAERTFVRGLSSALCRSGLRASPISALSKDIIFRMNIVGAKTQADGLPLFPSCIKSEGIGRYLHKGTHTKATSAQPLPQRSHQGHFRARIAAKTDPRTSCGPAT